MKNRVTNEFLYDFTITPLTSQISNITQSSQHMRKHQTMMNHETSLGNNEKYCMT